MNSGSNSPAVGSGQSAIEKRESGAGNRQIGKFHYRFGETDSTNSRALEYVNDTSLHGAVFQADYQTKGRGQYGRNWQAEPNGAILLSVLLFPPPELCRPIVLTALAAISVLDTVGEWTGRIARIKWPNDVLVEGKKICGILIESRPTREGGTAMVCGIGLNGNQTSERFEEKNLPLATSLRIETGAICDIGAVTAKLLARLDAEYEHLLSGGISCLEERWKRGFNILSQPVEIELGNSTRLNGVLYDLTFESMVLRTGDTTRVIAPEEVKRLLAP